MLTIQSSVSTDGIETNGPPPFLPLAAITSRQIEDLNGEKFGYYLNTQLVEKYDQMVPVDFYTFEFNLQSNWRLSKPTRFEMMNEKEGGYLLSKKEAYVSNKSMLPKWSPQIRELNWLWYNNWGKNW